MNDWAVVPSRRLFRIVNGGTPTADPEHWDGDVRWATPADLASVDGGYICDTKRCISRTGLVSGSRSVPKGSLILSIRAPIGYIAQTVSEVAFNQGCRGLVPRTALDARFFRYQFKARARQLAAEGSGSTFMELSSENLAATRLHVPPLEQQRAIANFLDIEVARIDAIIAKKISLLSVADERFKAEVSERTHAGISANPSLIRQLPRDWHRPQLRRCFKAVDYGIGDATTAFGNIPVLGMGNIDDRGCIVGQPGGFVDAVDERMLLRPGDLLFNRTNSLALVGKVGLVVKSDTPTTFASYLVRMRTSQLADAEYLNYALNSTEFLSIARSVALPSIGQANLNPARYSELHIALPPIRKQRDIAQELNQERRVFDLLRRRLERQIELLRERRQALITATVTGERDVPAGVEA